MPYYFCIALQKVCNFVLFFLIISNFNKSLKIFNEIMPSKRSTLNFNIVALKSALSRLFPR